MALTVQFLFDRPQSEIASTLRGHLANCRAAWIIAGFSTVEGIELLAPALKAHPTKLRMFVVGAGTYRAYQSMDTLISSGIPADRFFVHLGHSRAYGTTKFQKYHPMLHSKIYLFEIDDETSVAVVGSHNVTGFALAGLNGEAACIVSGSTNEAEMQKIYAHVTTCRSQAIPYRSDMKEGLADWAYQFFDGLRIKAKDTPQDAENRTTVVVLLAEPTGRSPTTGESIYFELPAALKERIESLKTEVHIYLLPSAPASAQKALAQIGGQVTGLLCSVFHIDDMQRTKEIDADWEIPDRHQPRLIPTQKPFRPRASLGMQQVAVTVEGGLLDAYEYLFESERVAWIPRFDQRETIRPSIGDDETLLRNKVTHAENGAWQLVVGLTRIEPNEKPEVSKALFDSNPESGSFVLFSLRRRKRMPEKLHEEP